jgi:PAS domain S-box-containing protein
LKAPGTPHGTKGYLLASDPAARGWIAALGAAGAVAVAYFLAARLGLALLSAPSDVAVFWPASGIAAGVLIIWGRCASPALVIGVVIGTVAANVMSDRSLLTSLLKGFCNAGEAVLAARLLEQWFGRPFTFGDLRRVVGFLAAAGLATAASAVGGAATMTLLHTAAPYWDVWRAFFLSDWVGIVVIAPLVIGLGQVWREPPSQAEWIEGVGVLALTALASFYVMSHHTGSWLSFSPGAVVLPLLLWLTARCQPTFGIAGAFVASAAVILAITFGVGRFGDAAVPIAERVKGAQVATTMVTTYTLVLIALFAQRRESEAQLAKKSAALARLHEISSQLWLKRDLRQALDELLAGAIELLGADMGTIRILDTQRGVLKVEAHRGFKQEILDFFDEVATASDSPCGRALRAGERMVIEDVDADEHFAPFRPLARAAGYRAMQSTLIMNREGLPLGMLATHFRSVHKSDEQDLRLLDLYVRQAADIIERHRAEDALRESEERLRLAQLRTGIGIWDWNLRTGKLTCTPELEAIFGLEPASVKTYADFRARVHPEDIEAIQAGRNAAVRRRETFQLEYRIIRPDGQVRWILAVGGAFYDEATGEPTRILGNNVDITERKQAELALAERNIQLTLAAKAGLVGTYAYDADTEIVHFSAGSAAIHGYPEGTTEIPRSEWLARVHPEDVEGIHTHRSAAFRQRRPNFSTEFRIVRPGGEIRWVETRTFVFYNDDGRPRRVVGVNIDVTERKQAEQGLAERNAQLDLAHKVARVGYFTYDISARTLRFSRSSAAIHGLSQSTMELTAQQWLARVHRDDMQRLRAEHIRALEERRGELINEFRVVRPGGEIRSIEARSLVTYNPAGRAECMTGVYIDVTERRKTEDHKNLLIAELDHRVKNVLACVAAVAQRTRECSRSADEFLDVLNGRINSLAKTHTLLSRSRWQGVDLGELVRSELAFCTMDESVLIEGPDVDLAAEATQPMAIVLHELATNAAKYGALSNGHGRLTVRWRRQANDGSGRKLVLEWRETGGPPLAAPNAPGFGTSVIRDLIPYELGGAVDYELAREGARCMLEIPAKWLRITGAGYRPHAVS